MPSHERHKIISLGDVAALGYSPEVDASSADSAILYVKNATAAASSIMVYSAPEPFGTSATWYTFGGAHSVPAGKNQAWSVPEYQYSEFSAARRMRFYSTKDVTMWVELVREIF